jgi:hypothetical protein
MSEHRSTVDGTTTDHLVSAGRTAMGDSLRSITYLRPDGHEQVYLRSDLSADADLSASAVHEAAGFRTRMAYEGSELGDYQYTIRVFENGFVMRVITADHGVVITTDGMTLRRSKEVAATMGDVLG